MVCCCIPPTVTYRLYYSHSVWESSYYSDVYLSHTFSFNNAFRPVFNFHPSLIYNNPPLPTKPSIYVPSASYIFTMNVDKVSKHITPSYDYLIWVVGASGLNAVMSAFCDYLFSLYGFKYTYTSYTSI